MDMYYRKTPGSEKVTWPAWARDRMPASKMKWPGRRRRNYHYEFLGLIKVVEENGVVKGMELKNASAPGMKRC